MGQAKEMDPYLPWMPWMPWLTHFLGNPMERSTIFFKGELFLWQFSLAMLNYQRVTTMFDH